MRRPSSVRPRGKRGLGEFDVAAQRVVNAHRLADFVGGRADVFDLAAENQVFDFVLDLVVELVAVGAEEFDAVVGVGIVRGGDDDAGVGAQAARDVGDAGRRQRADEQHVHAHRKDAGGDGVFEHVAGKPRVLADDDFVPAAAARLAFEVFEDVRGGAAELERGFGGDRFDVGRAADAVGAEDFFGVCSWHLFRRRRDDHADFGRIDADERHAGRRRNIHALAQIARGLDAGQIHDRVNLVGLQVRHDVGRPAHVDGRPTLGTTWKLRTSALTETDEHRQVRERHRAALSAKVADRRTSGVSRMLWTVSQMADGQNQRKQFPAQILCDPVAHGHKFNCPSV